MSTHVRISRRGMTLLEVMIAILILAIILGSVAQGMTTLYAAQRTAKDRAIVVVICRTLAERVFGGTWSNLGMNVDASVIANQNSWSWNRRLYPSNAATANPPMDEVSANPLNRLDAIYNANNDPISPAIEKSKSGVPNLQVYLEYYKIGLFTAMQSSADPRGTWLSNVNANVNPYNFDDTSAFGMALTNYTDAIVCRVVATWSPRGSTNATETYELDFMRKK